MQLSELSEALSFFLKFNASSMVSSASRVQTQAKHPLWIEFWVRAFEDKKIAR
ncbi:hypothetical protein DQM68_07005 [Leptospira mayottensis]|uniref:Uncharacterized protein n=2 Tax=Leptospira mayottensis TaxID=1137606 RepID=A0AA87T0E2_9LEPT|nr:hypothetical protein DQM68_07005 [Leptospira mayottensis]AXR64284.1 hypothetical protein DQM28_08695 [Leptospira mayottensis]AXR67996.1 hypothetical protein DPV73_08170 [Leptospira mayottensis]EKS02228.1 hypothetical protein LEP1GSC125_0836 [Leptospira mayottensis 200901122]TGM97199.1 hypothetical protein EHR03_15015 [Leptospira mayottensis]